jgi:hypothetical protein
VFLSFTYSLCLLSLVVYEKDDRVGGRTMHKEFEGQVIEIGGSIYHLVLSIGSAHDTHTRGMVDHSCFRTGKLHSKKLDT